jgi:tetratricopeptide (TPR) repeat protein
MTIPALPILEQNGLVHPAQLEPELEFIFKHALVQEASYASLLKADRKTLHRVVAEIVEETHPNRLTEFAGTLAYHYAAAGDDRKAVEYLLMAGEQILSQFALRMAQPLFDQAAEIARANGWHVELGRACGGLGEIYRLTGETEKSIASFSEAIEKTTSPQMRGYYFMQLGQTYHLNLYQFDRSLEYYKKAEEEFLKEAEPGKLGRLYTNLGYYHAIMPVPDDVTVGLEYLAKACELLESTQHYNDYAFACGYTALAYSELEAPKGIEWGKRTLALCSQYGLIEPKEVAAIALGHAHRISFRFEEAAQYYRQALQENSITGYVIARALIQINLAQTLTALGRFHEALESLQEAEELFHKLNHKSVYSWVKPVRSFVLRELKRDEEADRETAEGLANARDKSLIYFRWIETSVLMKRDEAAIALLKQYRPELSFQVLNALRLDPIYAHLRNNPDFLSLLGDL